MQKEKRIENFERLGLGMFLHYGVYTVPGRGEWLQSEYSVSKEKYNDFKNEFFAENLDFDKIVSIAKKTGFKYMVLTARHHDGFSLYDTRGLSDYDVIQSPVKRDLVAEFLSACRRHGMFALLYHTTIDWYNDDFRSDIKKYLEYLRESVKLLCTNYGDIGGFWFDGNWEVNDIDWEEDKLYAVIRQYQPDAVIINNTGEMARGKLGHPEIDSVTFEKGLPRPFKGNGKYIAGEMCDTINDHWASAYYDINYKSVKTIIENMIDCRTYSANYLLNLPLEKDGTFSHISLGILEQLKKWNEIYGVVMSAIFYAQSGDGDVLLKNGDSLYLVVKNLTNKGKRALTRTAVFENIAEDISSINWMDNGNSLDFCKKNDRLEVDITHFTYGMNMVVRVAKLL